MSNQQQIDAIAHTYLGKHTEYHNSYNPDILVAIPRVHNRIDHQIDETFEGSYDIWHNYECSFLTDNGYPVSLVGKIKIPANSPNFIESKSMKLYFFSMHMMKLGKTKEDAITNFKALVQQDLSSKTQSDVEFEVFEKSSHKPIFVGYKDIEELVDVNKVQMNVFKESPDLMVKDETNDEIKVVIRNVRSNCRVTHQPDFANLYLYIKGEVPTLESLLQYVVSFRNEFHFHEEVTEQIFNNIKKRFDVKELAVSNLFTRRGGLDICPVRVTHQHLLDEHFIDVNELPSKTVYQ